MQPLLQDVLSTLGFVMLHIKHIWSPVHVIVNSWMEWSMLISLNDQVDLRTSMWSPYKTKGTSSLRTQVALTATLTKALDSTTEEVEFWQGKYEEAMKTIQKMKRHCPQDWETLSDGETEKFSSHSPPRKTAMCAPPIHVIPNDVEVQE
jgi:hypothetical protein